MSDTAMRTCGEKVHILFIDNFDSFVFNLVDEFAARGSDVTVWRNDVPASDALGAALKMPAPRLVVLSPGPGLPSEAGCCVDLVRAAPSDLPLFGVCLGHQAIAEAFGGHVVRAPEIVHGKVSQINHCHEGIFAGLDSPLAVGRYHSLAVEHLPVELEVRAWFGELIMGLEHKDRPIVGVQFHPESILTPHGGRLIDNVLSLSRNANRDEKISLHADRERS